MERESKPLAHVRVSLSLAARRLMVGSAASSGQLYSGHVRSGQQAAARALRLLLASCGSCVAFPNLARSCRVE